MKTKRSLLIMLLLAIFILAGTSCRVVTPRYHHPSRTVIIQTNPNAKIPPGKMKKATGAKSAKQYAPGQQKKHKKNK